MSEAFDRMRSDHRQVLDRVARLEGMLLGGEVRALGEAEMKALLGALALFRDQFATHAAAEDEVLFPALVEALPETRHTVAPLEAEHAELRDMLVRLEATLAEPVRADRDEQIAVQLRDYIDLLRIHIRKEEALVIRVAEQVLRPDEVQALAARMSRNPRPGRDGGPSEARKGVGS